MCAVLPQCPEYVPLKSQDFKNTLLKPLFPSQRRRQNTQICLLLRGRAQLLHTTHAVCCLLNLNCSSNSCCFFSLCSWSLSYKDRGSYASSGHSERNKSERETMLETLNHQQFSVPSCKNHFNYRI